MEQTADVVIIGAGVMGTSTAFQLVQRGVRRVVVLEKSTVAAGSSGKSSALVRMHYTFLPEARLALLSLGWFQEWRERVGGSCGFTKTGFVRLVAPEKAPLLRQNVARLQGIGVNTCLVSSAELRALDRGIETQDVAIAAYEPDSGYADGYATAQAFMAAARRGGAVLHQGVTVTGIQVHGDRIQGVETSAGNIATPVVISTAGPWSGPLLRRIGLFRPDSSGLVLVGYGPGEDGVDPDAYRDTVDEEVKEGGALHLAQRYPALQQAGMRRGYAGCYTMTPDGKMIVDRAPGIEGLYIGAGFSGTGFKISPAVGIALAELAMHGRAATVDVSPFRATRFAEGRALRATVEYLDRPYDPVDTADRSPLQPDTSLDR